MRPGCWPTGASTAWPLTIAAASWPKAPPSVATPLNRYIGYEAAAKVAKDAVAERTTIRQTVLDLGFVDRGELTLEQLDAALDVLAMTRPPR